MVLLCALDPTKIQTIFVIGAIDKRRRNILGGEGSLKLRCCKILEGRS